MDPFQLAPIEANIEDKEDSVTFQHTGAELTQAVRYDGPIRDLGDILRREIDRYNTGQRCTKFIISSWQTEELGYLKRTSCLDENGSGYIFLNDARQVIKLGVENFKDENPDNIRILAYRNNTLAGINTYMREYLYAEYLQTHNKLEQFMPGELIINNGGYGQFINNNETFRVVSVTKTIEPKWNIPCLALELFPSPSETAPILVVDEQDNELFLRILSEKKAQGKANPKHWVDYYAFYEYFARFDYSYGQTSHRA
jgi:hypothetical protein